MPSPANSFIPCLEWVERFAGYNDPKCSSWIIRWVQQQSQMVNLLLFSKHTPASYSSHSFSCSYSHACETSQWTYQYPSDKIKVSAWTNLNARAEKVEELIAGHGFKNSGVSKGQNNVSLHLCPSGWDLGNRKNFLSDIPPRNVKIIRNVWESSPSKLYKWEGGRRAFSPRWHMTVKDSGTGKCRFKIAPV